MMNIKKVVGSAIDFEVQENGTATGTISFVDADGKPTAAQVGSTFSTTLTTSNPALGAKVDMTGLEVTLTPVAPVPVPLATDMTVTAVTKITVPGGGI